jgi:hypothetical protein
MQSARPTPTSEEEKVHRRPSACDTLLAPVHYSASLAGSAVQWLSSRWTRDWRDDVIPFVPSARWGSRLVGHLFEVTGPSSTRINRLILDTGLVAQTSRSGVAGFSVLGTPFYVVANGDVIAQFMKNVKKLQGQEGLNMFTAVFGLWNILNIGHDHPRYQEVRDKFHDVFGPHTFEVQTRYIQSFLTQYLASLDPAVFHSMTHFLARIHITLMIQMALGCKDLPKKSDFPERFTDLMDKAVEVLVNPSTPALYGMATRFFKWQNPPLAKEKAELRKMVMDEIFTPNQEHLEKTQRTWFRTKACDLFLVVNDKKHADQTDGLKKDEKQNSDRTHLHLYKKGDDALVYYVENKEYAFDAKLSKEARAFLETEKLNTNGILNNNPLSPAHRALCLRVLAETSKRGHTLNEGKLDTSDDTIGDVFQILEGIDRILPFLLMVLQKYPDIKQQIEEEIRELIRSTGRRSNEWTLADINRLAYTRAVIMAAAERYPPFPTFPRVASDNIKITVSEKKTEVTIPKGAVVVFSPELRHQKNHKDAKDSKNSKDAKDYKDYKDSNDYKNFTRMIGQFRDKPFSHVTAPSFLTFGLRGAARACPGGEGSVQRTIQTVATLLENYDFKLNRDDHLEHLEYSATLTPKHHVELKIEPRDLFKQAADKKQTPTLGMAR